MTDITIRRVPDSTLATLKARAAQTGKSLQAYLWDVIAREAAHPTFAEVTAQAEAEASARLSGDDVLSAIDDARRGR
jgi:plasmid stability protein